MCLQAKLFSVTSSEQLASTVASSQPCLGPKHPISSSFRPRSSNCACEATTSWWVETHWNRCVKFSISPKWVKKCFKHLQTTNQQKSQDVATCQARQASHQALLHHTILLFWTRRWAELCRRERQIPDISGRVPDLCSVAQEHGANVPGLQFWLVFLSNTVSKLKQVAMFIWLIQVGYSTYFPTYQGRVSRFMRVIWWSSPAYQNQRAAEDMSNARKNFTEDAGRLICQMEHENNCSICQRGADRMSEGQNRCIFTRNIQKPCHGNARKEFLEYLDKHVKAIDLEHPHPQTFHVALWNPTPDKNYSPWSKSWDLTGTNCKGNPQVDSII